MQTLLTIRDLRKSFGPVEVLKGIDLDCAKGEVTCIIGPSGSGKSTVLRCVNHLEKPDSGSIVLQGESLGYETHKGRMIERAPSEIAEQRQRVGMVFQRFNLFPHLTAAENICLGPVKVKGVGRRAASARAQELLGRVGLADRGDAYPRELSGGQQQRVAIARALAMDPALLLFDEPTSALDPELVGDVLAVMTDIAQQGMTMIVVTHELQFAREVATNVVFVDEGRIVESGDPRQVLEAPTHERTKSFISRVFR